MAEIRPGWTECSGSVDLGIHGREWVRSGVDPEADTLAMVKQFTQPAVDPFAAFGFLPDSDHGNFARCSRIEIQVSAEAHTFYSPWLEIADRLSQIVVVAK